jgi:hypothetical protein
MMIMRRVEKESAPALGAARLSHYAVTVLTPATAKTEVTPTVFLVIGSIHIPAVTDKSSVLNFAAWARKGERAGRLLPEAGGTSL